MTTWLIRCFALLLLMLPFVPAVADDPGDKEIERLVKQLGSDDFEERQAATKRLTEIGEPALDALVRALKSNDLEARRRAEAIIALVDTRLYGPELSLIADDLWVWSVSISVDGKHLLTSGNSATLRLWDTYTGELLCDFVGHKGPILGAVLSPDGKRVLSGGRDGTVRLWDAVSGKELQKMVCPNDREVLCVAFGPPGQVLSGDTEGKLRRWDLGTGKDTVVFAGQGWARADQAWVRVVAYSDKAKLAATCDTHTVPFGMHGPIHLWNLETGKEVHRFADDTKDIYSMRFSPDGKQLLAAFTDGALYFWDVETGKERKRIADANALDAALSPDGKRMASSGYYHRSIRFSDAQTGKLVRHDEDRTDRPVLSVMFFPDGKRIATAGHKGIVRICRVPR
jgi:WD40 repeat protein